MKTTTNPKSVALGRSPVIPTLGLAVLDSRACAICAVCVMAWKNGQCIYKTHTICKLDPVQFVVIARRRLSPTIPDSIRYRVYYLPSPAEKFVDPDFTLSVKRPKDSETILESQINE